MKRKTEHFTYELIRAKRRSMSLKVDLDGTITVRAPLPDAGADSGLVCRGTPDWIEVRLESRRADHGGASVPTRIKNGRKAENGQQRRSEPDVAIMLRSWASLTGRSRSGSRRPAGEAMQRRKLEF